MPRPVLIEGKGVSKGQAEGTKQTHESDVAENDAANILAQAGYEAEQLPDNIADGDTKPDIKVGGEPADINTPQGTTGVQDIGKTIVKKVPRQARRVVINAVSRGNPVTAAELLAEIMRRKSLVPPELEELEEVILITKGPPPDNKTVVVTVWPEK